MFVAFFLVLAEKKRCLAFFKNLSPSAYILRIFSACSLAFIDQFE